MQFRDYYDILGVSRGVSQDEIKKAFRQKSRQYHPDVSKEENAEDKFKEVNEAYEVLKDPETRKRYDLLGANYKHGQNVNPPPGWQGFDFDFGGGGGFPGGAGGAGPAGAGGAFSDFFEAFFGRGGFKQQFWGNQGPMAHGEDREISFIISVEDAFACETRKVTLSDGGKSKTYDVKIPRGTTEGTRIRLPKLGTKGQGGGKDGDLLLNVGFASHPRFEVDGYNLEAELRLTPWEAALGAKIPFETVDGEVKLTIPAGSQTGQQLRLKGKGLPTRSEVSGNILVTLKVVVPTELTAEERALFEQLSDTSSFDPR